MSIISKVKSVASAVKKAVTPQPVYKVPMTPIPKSTSQTASALNSIPKPAVLPQPKPAKPALDFSNSPAQTKALNTMLGNAPKPVKPDRSSIAQVPISEAGPKTDYNFNPIKPALASATSALRSTLGGKGRAPSYASEGDSRNSMEGSVENPHTPVPGTPVNIGGKTGIERTTSIKPSNSSVYDMTDESSPSYQERSQRQTFLSERNNERQSQLAALQSQIDENKSAFEAATAAETSQDKEGKRMGVPSLTIDPEEKESKKFERQMLALQRAVEEAKQLTPEEIQAQEQENTLIAAEGQVNADLNQKVTDVNKEPVPLAFAQGWGTTFNKDANAKLQTLAAQRVPLRLKLATLQQKRQAAQEAAKFGYEAGKDTYNRATDRKKEKKLDTRYEQEQASKEKERQDNLKQKQIEQANIDRKYTEDVRQYGLDYAIKQRQLSTDQMKANKPESPSTEVRIINNRQILINKVTGDTIRDLGPAPRET